LWERAANDGWLGVWPDSYLVTEAPLRIEIKNHGKSHCELFRLIDYHLGTHERNQGVVYPWKVLQARYSQVFRILLGQLDAGFPSTVAVLTKVSGHFRQISVKAATWNAVEA